MLVEKERETLGDDFQSQVNAAKKAKREGNMNKWEAFSSGVQIAAGSSMGGESETRPLEPLGAPLPHPPLRAPRHATRTTPPLSLSILGSRDNLITGSLGRTAALPEGWTAVEYKTAGGTWKKRCTLAS